MKSIVFAMSVTLLLVACTPEVGSERWCENLKQKPKGEWTANQALDFTKYCLFKPEQKN